MPDHGDLPIDLRLDRYYDEVFLGDPAGSGKDALDPALAATVRRLRELAAVESANPEFASKLWKDLAPAQDTAIDNRPRELSFAANPAQSRIRSLPWPDFKVPGERRKWFVAQFAMAALLVITLVASWFTFRPGQHNPGAPNSESDMPMVHGNPARTGEQPGPVPAGKPKLLWRFRADGDVFNSPVVVNGIAYLGNTAGILFAVDTATGTELWQAESGAITVGAAAVTDGIVYAQYSDGLFAVNAETGEVIWRYQADVGVNSSPVVLDGAVYFGSGLASSPAIVDGIVYVGGDAKSTFYSVDAISGAERWHTQLASDGLFALDAATGAKRWHFATSVRVRSGPAVVDGIAYFATNDGTFHAVAAETGKERWTFKIEGSGSSAPVVVEGIAYVGGQQGDLYALDAATGAERWRASVGDPNETSPAVADGVVYVGGKNVLHALNAVTGEELWSYPVSFVAGGAPRIAVPDLGPVLAGGVIYLIENGDELIALGNH
jgi:eukaryotic-like serine/threonine-protein kinase